MRRRRQKTAHAHYYLLVNPKATGFQARLVERLTEAIHRNGRYYTVFEAPSATELVRRAQLACGLVKSARPAPVPIQRRGPVTALVACGGDGTINLVAQVALRAGIPVGILPMGKHNNIARALYRTVDTDGAIASIMQRDYRTIDTATASGRLFIGSLGLGLIPALARMLENRAAPRFAFGWSQLVSQAQSGLALRRVTITIDAFSFHCRPSFLSINLLSHAIGLPFSPVSIANDHQVETIFDVRDGGVDLAGFVRLVRRGKHCFGGDIRLYRGRQVTVRPIKGQQLYLDGDVIEARSNALEVSLNEQPLKIFC